jgi:hypothetical protein
MHVSALKPEPASEATSTTTLTTEAHMVLAGLDQCQTAYTLQPIARCHAPAPFRSAGVTRGIVRCSGAALGLTAGLFVLPWLFWPFWF